jgi:hypothetical protein
MAASQAQDPHRLENAAVKKKGPDPVPFFFFAGVTEDFSISRFRDRADQRCVALIRFVRVDHQNRVNQARHVEEQRQDKVEHGLHWFAAKQHSQGREQNGDQVQHGVVLSGSVGTTF